jgi:hypothetical protein
MKLLSYLISLFSRIINGKILIPETFLGVKYLIKEGLISIHIVIGFIKDKKSKLKMQNPLVDLYF